MLVATLKKNREFKQVYSSGKSIASPYLVLYWYSNNKEKNRYGFSISKKIGKAVVRNKLKRRLKEIIRLKEEKICMGYDIIIIARNPINKLDFQKLKKDLIKLYKKAGIWCHEI